MKKLLATTLGLLLFLSLVPVSMAEFTVIPTPPHDRQFNFEIPPGQSQSASVMVKNLGSNPITVSTYSADGTNSSQGTFALTSRSHDQKHIGRWVEFEQESLTIPARQDVTVPFTITVPENTTPGNYGGGIAVEATSAELSGGEEIAESGAVNSTARIYVRTFVDVPGERTSQYEWSDFSFNGRTDSTKSQFHFSFKNNGNTIIIAEPSVELVGFPPLENSTLSLPQITIQPGTALNNIGLRWDDQPSFGYYSATANVTFSEVDILQNQKTNSQTLQRKMMINLTPPLLIVIILVVVIGVVGFIAYRIISIQQLRKNSTSYKVKQGDTLGSIAKKHNISWQQLARMNKLRKPYSLKAGQTIRVPSKK